MKRNPVARAVAVNELCKALVSYRISIYMRDDGESCEDVTIPLAQVLLITLQAAANDGIKGPGMDVIESGLVACLDMTRNDKMDKSKVNTVMDAIDAMEALLPRITYESIHRFSCR